LSPSLLYDFPVPPVGQTAILVDLALFLVKEEAISTLSPSQLLLCLYPLGRPSTCPPTTSILWPLCPPPTSLVQFTHSNLYAVPSFLMVVPGRLPIRTKSRSPRILRYSFPLFFVDLLHTEHSPSPRSQIASIPSIARVHVPLFSQFFSGERILSSSLGISMSSDIQAFWSSSVILLEWSTC